MKKFFLCLFLTIFCVTSGYALPNLQVKNASDTSTPATPTWVIATTSVPVNPIAIGALSIGAASKTITVSPGEIEDFGNYIPIDATGFTFNVYDSDILIGASSDLATGSSKYSGYLVASGSYNNKWDKEVVGRFSLGVTPNSTSTATIKIGVVYGK